jgi:hypothetical protein
MIGKRDTTLLKAARLASWLAVGGLTAGGAQASGQEVVPAFRRALPAAYFQCRVDADCVIAQGWCATFAINKAMQAAFDALPADPKGKASGGCPPGWLPPSPRAVCIEGQCRVVSRLP